MQKGIIITDRIDELCKFQSHEFDCLDLNSFSSVLEFRNNCLRLKMQYNISVVVLKNVLHFIFQIKSKKNIEETYKRFIYYLNELSEYTDMVFAIEELVSHKMINHYKKDFKQLSYEIIRELIFKSMNSYKKNNNADFNILLWDIRQRLLKETNNRNTHKK